MPDSVFIIVIVSIAAVSSWVLMAIWRGGGRKQSKNSLDAVEKRLARLEVAIDDMATELGRVTEGQRFLTQALGERPAIPVIRETVR